MPIEYASDDELRAMGPPERGASWRQRGYRPLAGLAEPNYATGTGKLMTCPSCNLYAAVDLRGCVGGTFSCWLRRRQGARHTDQHCRECGHVWTDA